MTTLQKHRNVYDIYYTTPVCSKKKNNSIFNFIANRDDCKIFNYFIRKGGLKTILDSFLYDPKSCVTLFVVKDDIILKNNNDNIIANTDSYTAQKIILYNSIRGKFNYNKFKHNNVIIPTKLRGPNTLHYNYNKGSPTLNDEKMSLEYHDVGNGRIIFVDNLLLPMQN